VLPHCCTIAPGQQRNPSSSERTRCKLWRRGRGTHLKRLRVQVGKERSTNADAARSRPGPWRYCATWRALPAVGRIRRHRSSEPIGAIAAALAKAQSKLINPERSLVGIIGPSSPRDSGRAFRYAHCPAALISCATICLRDKEHQKSVARQPCLVCGLPSDPHEPVWRSPVPPLFDQMQHGRTYLEQRPAPKSAVAALASI
jgi:hypothetical protein